MGGVPSSLEGSARKRHEQLKFGHAQVLHLMMPVFYTKDQTISAEEMAIATDSWGRILDDSSPEFIRRKEVEGESFSHASCVTFFYDSFYKRLFDVHPLCKPMFKSGMKSQGKFLMKLISLALSLLNDENKFKDTLADLAERHNLMGIKAIEYGVVGEVFFWTIHHSLGDEAYTVETHSVWVKIFSRMLSVMVPVALAYEIKMDSIAQLQRTTDLENSVRKKIEDIRERVRSEHSKNSEAEPDLESDTNDLTSARTTASETEKEKEQARGGGTAK